MLEDLNTVHGLTKEIERLRAGSEDGHTPEMKLTAGQLWKRLLELNEKRRIEMLRSLLLSADEGAVCSMESHKADLDERYRQVVDLSREVNRWKISRRLISLYINMLRGDQQEEIERGTVADKLELFLKGGEGPVEGAGRILCGHRWTEAGWQFECAEPVGEGGLHQGEHYAYVREGSAAEEELRMKYLEDENDSLRDRLGLPRNRRRT